MTDLDELERKARAVEDAVNIVDPLAYFKAKADLLEFLLKNTESILSLISEVREARKMKQENG